MNNNLSKSPFNFNLNNDKNKNIEVKGKDLLFNKKKISDEVASLSSMSSMSSLSSSNAKTNRNKEFFNNRKNIKDDDDDEEDDDEDDDDNISKSNDDDDDDDDNEDDEKDEDDEDDEDEDDDDEDDDDDKYKKIKNGGGSSVKNILKEKKEILYQLERLESKGIKTNHNFDMSSDLEEMKMAYNKIIKDKEIDASIRFQRKMLMAFVSGIEYLNTRYEPLPIKLDGWSEQVHDNIDDYDDIFEELHLKYKSTGKKMAPELRLFISLTGSAFMFHLTSRMFKETPLPDVENVLKSNPELMKQFQNAAAKQYMFGDNSKKPIQQQQQIRQPFNNNSGGGMGGGGGVFGMIGNLFSGLTGGGGGGMGNRPQSFQNIPKNEKPINDINNIINNVHNNISLNQQSDDNKLETLSISDEEITSIIEDVADIKVLKQSRGRKPANARTLNI